MYIVAALLKLTTAPPNPITDNETDQSKEEHSYKYPDFAKAASHPYWHAFAPEFQFKLKEHDRLELNVLHKIRPLDFKLREAWTRTDKPFAASH